MEQPIMQCPNPECRNSMDRFIKKISVLLFGPDENSGLLLRIRKIEDCVKTKISRGWLISTGVAVTGILCLIFIPMISGMVKDMRRVSDNNIKLEARVASHDIALEDLKDAIKESEDRIKEHIDLVIKAHDAEGKTKSDWRSTYQKSRPNVD